MMDPDEIQRHMERGVIEIAPLAYMRGRTLNNAYVILDEAQNTTSEQMLMFLTRMGFDSKVVITGDITQVDLPGHKMSGLIEIQGILQEIPGLEIVYFDEHDVVRHELVQKIISRIFEIQRGTGTPPPGIRGERQRQTARGMIPDGTGERVAVTNRQRR